MRYRKLKADYLFTGEKLLTGENVLITNDKGKIINMVNEADAGEGLEVFEGIISPGFINAHCHLELSHLKNIIPEGTGLVDFVFKVVSERHFEESEILSAMEIAEQEMMSKGIVAVGDISNNSLSAKQKKKKNLQYYNFIETSGWLPQVAEARFEKSKAIFEEFEKDGMPASVVPHAPYSVSDELWKLMIPYFEGKTISIHNQETAEEDIFFMEGKGAFIKMYEMMNIDNSFYRAKKIRSVESYFKRFSSAASVILVHNTFTQQQDIDFIKRYKNEAQMISFCLCPNANLYIENALPDVDLFVKNDCNIILGTDSLASNRQLDILEEIKTIAKNFPSVKTESLLKWATINGAKALQMETTLGSFEKNKKPGIVLIENVHGENIIEKSKVKRLI
ncbi:MAG: amidohydrolase family protein [Bacteroidota bacterium]|nr:amidohydrolase family protein [Bacteroidota bacterium]